MSKFNIRLAKPEDIAFIKDTWLYSLYNGNDQYRRVNKDTFFTNYSAIIDMILTRPNTLVKVATLPDDHDIIISYAAVQHFPSANVLHYVYTKKLWRGQEAHVELIPEYKYYTHITRQWLAIKPKDKEFNPFLIGV